MYISGDHKLAGKLKSARKLAQRRVLQRQDSIFSTNQEGAATKAAATKELDDWDTAMQARDNVRN